jgi:2EXR family
MPTNGWFSLQLKIIVFSQVLPSKSTKSKTSKSVQPGNGSIMVAGTDREFTLFHKLPIELPRMIWKYATPKQRVVKLMADGCTQETNMGRITKNGLIDLGERLQTKSPPTTL